MSVDTAAAAAQAEALKVAVRQILAPILMGSFFSCILLGLVAALVIYYFTHFTHDRLIFRLLVAFLTLMSLYDTGVAIAWSWIYAIRGFSNPEVLASWPRPFSLYILGMGIVIFVTQLFFTWRVWIVSGGKSYFLTGLKLALIFFGVGAAVYIYAKCWNFDYLLDYVQLKQFVWAYLACGLVTDGLITFSMVWYIWFPNGVVHTNETVRSSALRRLVLLSFRTNGVALVVQATTLALAVSQTSSLLYAGPGLLETKVYIACFLITLNARTCVDGKSSNPSSSSCVAPVNSHVLRTFRTKSRFGSGGNSTASAAAVHVQVDEEVAVDGVDGPQLPYAIDLHKEGRATNEEKGLY